MLEKFLEVEGVEELTVKAQKNILGGGEPEEDRKGGKTDA
jgi:hypothetical protein